MPIWYSRGRFQPDWAQRFTPGSWNAAASAIAPNRLNIYHSDILFTVNGLIISSALPCDIVDNWIIDIYSLGCITVFDFLRVAKWRKTDKPQIWGETLILITFLPHFRLPGNHHWNGQLREHRYANHAVFQQEPTVIPRFSQYGNWFLFQIYQSLLDCHAEMDFQLGALLDSLVTSLGLSLLLKFFSRGWEHSLASLEALRAFCLSPQKREATSLDIVMPIA